MFKIAVLLSVYLGSKLSEVIECFESILNQDYNINDVHIYIYIDGPINMELWDYIYKLRSSQKFGKFVICEQLNNQGLTKALNTLINLLENEKYIFRMDTDDICSSDRFKKQILYLESNPDIGICGSFITEFNSKSQIFKKTYPIYPNVKDFYYGCPIAHPTVVFRLESLKKLQQYNDVRYSEDLDMWFRALLLDIKFYNVPEYLLRYRITEQFYNRRSATKAFVEFKTYIKYLTKIDGIKPQLLLIFIRFIFRLAPKTIVKLGYRSENLRNR